MQLLLLLIYSRVPICLVFTSAQTAELRALMRACHLAERNPAHIIQPVSLHSEWFITMGCSGNKGFLISRNQSIQKSQQISALLDAFHWLKQLAILTIPGHSEPNAEEAKGNNLTDKAAQRTELHRTACSERVCPAPCGCSISDLLQLNRWYISKNWTPGTEALKFQPAKQF